MKKETLIPQHLVDLMDASRNYMRTLNAAYKVEKTRLGENHKDAELLQMLEQAQESATDTLSNIGSYVGDLLADRMLAD